MHMLAEGWQQQVRLIERVLFYTANLAQGPAWQAGSTSVPAGGLRSDGFLAGWSVGARLLAAWQQLFCLKTKSMADKRRRVKQTSVWEAADLEYSALYVDRQLPLFGAPMSAQMILDRLAEIVRLCPEFYPAVTELAVYRLAEGAGQSEVRRLTRGLRLLLELADTEQWEEQLEAMLDNVARTMRYDVLESCLRCLLERQPNNAFLHDQLAFTLAQLGHDDAAIEEAEKAVQMEPNKAHYHCNLAFYYLMAGNVHKVRSELQIVRVIGPELEYLGQRRLSLHTSASMAVLIQTTWSECWTMTSSIGSRKATAKPI